jgi:hypothetical protein
VNARQATIEAMGLPSRRNSRSRPSKSAIGPGRWVPDTHSAKELVEEPGTTVAQDTDWCAYLDRALVLGNPMATKLTDRIVEILRGCPYGLTAKEVAARLGATASNISSRLSKLAAYGIIIKTRGRIAHDASPCAIYNAPLPASGATLARPK